MTRRLTPDLSAVLALAVAACGGRGDADAGTGGWTAVTDTVADTIVVRTVGGSVWGRPMRLVPEVTIGVLEGAETYMFGDILAINAGRRGEIYVTDGQVPALRMYGEDGTWVRDIGREGGGPGEYREPDGGLAVLRDGRVLLRDPGNNRIAVYSADGEYLESWPLATNLSSSNQLWTDTAGGIYTVIIKNLGVPVTEWEWGVARIADRGASPDTLTPPEWEFEEWQVSGSSSKGGNRSASMRSVPYAPGADWYLSPFGYFVGGVSTDFRITLFRRDEPPLRIEKEWNPVPVNPREAAILRRQIEENFRRAYPGWKWNGPPIPNTKPAFASLLVGDDGRIWVRVHAESVESMSAEELRQEEKAAGSVQNPFREPVRFDVFEPDGSYLGRVLAPEEFQMNPQPVFRGDTAWAVVADDLGVQRVSRFRLEPAE